MQQSRVRFTIRGMMIAVALVALFLRGGPGLASLVILPVYMWLPRERAQKRGAALKLQILRPGLKRLEMAAIVLWTMLVGGSLSYPVLIGMPPPAGYRLLEASWFGYAWIGLFYWPCFRWRHIEFRERGLVHGLKFWPWENIRSWDWRDGGSSLQLTLPYRINTYGIARTDRERIQVILENHVGAEKPRSTRFLKMTPECYA